jgi:NAD(P)-dependent dehydrogenase (short-subunit alcohol dehydrogenase family)
LINCAGIVMRGEEHQAKVFQQVMEVNLAGAMRVCAAARRLHGRGASALVSPVFLKHRGRIFMTIGIQPVALAPGTAGTRRPCASHPRPNIPQGAHHGNAQCCLCPDEERNAQCFTFGIDMNYIVDVLATF